MKCANGNSEVKKKEKGGRDLALGLWPKRMVNGVVVSVECTHGKNKKQIKCVKERALGDKASMWSKLWRTRDTPKCSYTLCCPIKIINIASGRIFKTTKKV